MLSFSNTIPSITGAGGGLGTSEGGVRRWVVVCSARISARLVRDLLRAFLYLRMYLISIYVSCVRRSSLSPLPRKRSLKHRHRPDTTHHRRRYRRRPSAMPVVYVAEPDPRRGRPRKLLQLIVPRLKDPDARDYERWEWDELRVDSSVIPGCGPMFGLYPRNTEALSWASLDRTTIVPYLGKETEVESSQLARLLRSSMAKVQSGQCPSSAPVPPQGDPVGSGQFSTPRERPAHWAPCRCLGCSSEPPPMPPIPPPLSLQA